MPRIKTNIKVLLVCTLLAGGVPLAPVETRADVNAHASPRQLGEGPVAERERGRALLRQGKAAEALIHLENALRLFKEGGERLGEASVNDLLGDLYERQGRYDVALKNFEAAYNFYLGESLRPVNNIRVVKALSPRDFAYNANLMLSKIGNVHLRRGDARQARAAFSKMQVTKPDKQTLETAAQGSVASGNPLSSVNKIKSGFGGLFGGSKKPSTSSPTATVTGIADTANRLQAPFSAYRETVIYTTYELGLGRVDFVGGQYESAKKHFDNVLSANVGSLPVVGKLRQTRVYRAAARTGLGDIAFAQGNFAEAVKLYDAAAKSAESDERLDLMWPAQRGTGKSLWMLSAQERDAAKATKLRADSLAAFRQALANIEKIRQGSLRADEARTTFLATTEDVFDEASAAFAESALLSRSPSSTSDAPLEGQSLEYAAEGLRVVEQGRARSLLDMLSETGAEITEGVPADLLKRKQENQARQQELAAQLTGVSVSADGPKRSVNDVEEELDRLQAEFDSIENQIRAASPRYAALTAAQPLTLADIQQRVLDEETALLEYSLGQKTSYLYAATKTGATLYRLPARAEVERQSVAVREQIIPASLRRALTDSTGEAKRGLTMSTDGAGLLAAANYATAAHALYKMAVEPAAQFVGQRRLLIVADGALNYVPFHALVTAAPPEGADYSTLPYLLKTNETVYAPSASVVAAVRQQAQQTSGAKMGSAMLLVADPVFAANDSRASAAPAPSNDTSAQGEASRGLSGVEVAVDDINAGRESAGGPPKSSTGGVTLVRLTGTRAEAQQIAALAQTTGTQADVWLDLKASEANVETSDLRQYRVVHFATHGLLNAERPQFTGVVLSLVGNPDNADGFLRTDEIFNLKLSSPLVMLSACETGLGKETRGEGVIGLTRAFMYAGAPTVGVSLWSVADKSTADLMTDFYKNLFAKQGTPPATAMRAARQNMIAGKKYSAPFYWAPFVLVGDWR